MTNMVLKQYLCNSLQSLLLFIFVFQALQTTEKCITNTNRLTPPPPPNNNNKAEHKELDNHLHSPSSNYNCTSNITMNAVVATWRHRPEELNRSDTQFNAES